MRTNGNYSEGKGVIVLFEGTRKSGNYSEGFGNSGVELFEGRHIV